MRYTIHRRKEHMIHTQALKEVARVMFITIVVMTVIILALIQASNYGANKITQYEVEQARTEVTK